MLVFAETISTISQWAFGNDVMNKILGASITIAIVIAFIMLLLIMLMYPASSDTSSIVLLKMFIYMTIFSFLVVFLHDGIIKHEADIQKDKNETLGIMSNNPSYNILHKPVQPSFQQNM